MLSHANNSRSHDTLCLSVDALTPLRLPPRWRRVWALFFEGAVVQIASGDFAEQLASRLPQLN